MSPDVDVSSLRIAVVYIYPITGEQVHIDLAERFISTYKRFPAGIAHRLYVVCNGGEPGPEDRARWADVDCEFFHHDDSGWDIGAFLHAGRDIDCDMMVCCGGHAYWVRDGWLRRMAEGFAERGPGLYGTSGSFERDIHIRTTLFWCHPGLLKDYPWKVTEWAERHEFEANPTKSITRFAMSKGLPCQVVAWDGIFDLKDARKISNTFRRGDQSNTLGADRYFDVWANSCRTEAWMRTLMADIPPDSPKSRLIDVARIIRMIFGD